jgi:PAS domain S-box-containing protein
MNTSDDYEKSKKMTNEIPMYSILLVDDEELFLEASRQYIEQYHPFRIDTACSACIALEKIRSRSFDAIVSDYAMPQMNGIDLLRIVRETYGDIPFILFTGKGREEVIIEALDNGVDYYLQKGGKPGPQFAELCHKITTSIEHRKSAERLKESEERFRFALDGANDGIWDLNLHTGELFVNNRTCEMLGYTFEDRKKPSLTWNDLFHPEDCLRATTTLQEYVKEGNSVLRIEHRYLTKLGDERWAVTRGKVVCRDINGSPLRIAGTYTDIHERKITEDALIASKEKLALLEGITRHDILNQVHALQGFLTILDDCGYNREGSRFIECIKGCCQKIKNHIIFAQNYQEIGLNAPKWHNIKKVAILAEQDNLPATIPLKIHNPDYEIYADPMLILVFSNIFENARKYGETITQVRIIFEERDAEGCLIIENDGVGIPSDIKEKIFNKGMGRNTGFGLFLVRQILGLTGLSIWENGVPDQGVRFEIIIPQGMWRRDSKGIDADK